MMQRIIRKGLAFSCTHADILTVFLPLFAGFMLISATAARDEVTECERLVKRELPEDDAYFRLGYRMVRDGPRQYTLHLSFFSSSRWLATCRLIGDQVGYRVADLELVEVARVADRRHGEFSP
jgi:hypothetical protein